MQEIYLLNDISWDTKEIYSKVYMNKDEAKKAFDELVQEYMDDHWLEESDFNRDNPAWVNMYLTDSAMYDWDEWIEIYFITLDLL